VTPKFSAIVSDFDKLLGGFFGECSVAFLGVGDGINPFFVGNS
jgi:hypothetical protein